jgi:hypothetical protein
MYSEKILFGKESFGGSFRWTSRKSFTNSQAATCHHLIVALESTHHFPVGASIRTHRAARSQGRTDTGGQGQPMVVPPKEGLEPKSSLGILHARFHSRENNFFWIYKVIECVFLPFFLPRVVRRERAERERERERHANFL